MFESVRSELISLSDSKYKEFNERIIPGASNMLGVRMPFLRKMSKKILEGDYKEYLEYDGDVYYEEVLLQGLVISGLKLNVSEIKEYILWYLPKIDNWALCDTFCNSLKIVNKYKDELFDFFLSLFDYGCEFYIRFVYVIFLNYYISKEYLDVIFDRIILVKGEEYYVMMAKAWLVSMCFIKYRSETLKFISDGEMDEVTHNKSIQKIIESRVVSDSDKEMLRRMKK